MATDCEAHRAANGLNSADDAGRDFLGGLIRWLVEDAGKARMHAASIPEDAFGDDCARALFRSITTALEVRAAPNLLEIKYIAEHEDDLGCDPSDVVVLLGDLYEAAFARPLHLWIDTAADQLRRRLACRNAAELGQAIASAARNGISASDDELEDVIRRARMIQLANRTGKAESRDLLSIADNWKRNKTEKQLLTGFRFIDRAFGGGLMVGVHGIAARPKAGKSAMASQIALGVMNQHRDARVLWFRGEMTDDQLFSKMLACWSKMRSPTIPPLTFKDALHRSPESQTALRDMLAIIGGRFITVDPPLTVAAIEHHIEEHRPSLVVVDYLQKCESPNFKDRREGLDHVVSRISMAATRHEIPIIVVSAVAGSKDRESEVGAITKESNRLDYDCHTLVTLWNDGPKEESPRRILMRVNASRTGQAIDDTLWFYGKYSHFQPAATYEEFDDFGTGATA